MYLFRSYIFCCLFYSMVSVAEQKVVIWGYPLYSHTHSYIHYGFYKAFKFLGYEVMWLTDSDEISNHNFTDTLFITAGDENNKKLPILTSAYYILHNCYSPRFDAVDDRQKLYLQVYTKPCEQERGNKKIAPCIFFNQELRTVYMPWATDLLPHEIDSIKRDIVEERQLLRGRIKKCVFLGTCTDCPRFGNKNKVTPFAQACSEYGVPFELHECWQQKPLFVKDYIEQTRDALLAPALQGEWQCRVGYVPCRIFKNISYGKIGITNNPTVYELFNKKIVFNEDTHQLFFDAINYLNTCSVDDILKLMDFVKNNHTYIHRIELLLNLLSAIRSQ